MNNDLVQEFPSAAKYVAEMERKMQEIKEDFTKEVISLVGSRIGKDNELCFPSFKNKTTKQVQKRHKGISGQKTIDEFICSVISFDIWIHVTNEFS